LGGANGICNDAIARLEACNFLADLYYLARYVEAEDGFWIREVGVHYVA